MTNSRLGCGVLSHLHTSISHQPSVEVRRRSRVPVPRPQAGSCLGSSAAGQDLATVCDLLTRGPPVRTPAQHHSWLLILQLLEDTGPIPASKTLRAWRLGTFSWKQGHGRHWQSACACRLRVDVGVFFLLLQVTFAPGGRAIIGKPSRNACEYSYSAISIATLRRYRHAFWQRQCMTPLSTWAISWDMEQIQTRQSSARGSWADTSLGETTTRRHLGLWT